jgi:hypothetical protein
VTHRVHASVEHAKGILPLPITMFRCRP